MRMLRCLMHMRPSSNHHKMTLTFLISVLYLFHNLRHLLLQHSILVRLRRNVAFLLRLTQRQRARLSAPLILDLSLLVMLGVLLRVEDTSSPETIYAWNAM